MNGYKIESMVDDFRQKLGFVNKERSSIKMNKLITEINEQRFQKRNEKSKAANQTQSQSIFSSRGDNERSNQSIIKQDDFIKTEKRA